jgi:hypothetical protein
MLERKKFTTETTTRPSRRKETWPGSVLKLQPRPTVELLQRFQSEGLPCKSLLS